MACSRALKGEAAGGRTGAMSAIKSFLFNVVTMGLGGGFLYVGYNEYLASNWPFAFVGIVGGTIIVLFSFAIMILKLIEGFS